MFGLCCRSAILATRVSESALALLLFLACIIWHRRSGAIWVVAAAVRGRAGWSIHRLGPAYHGSVSRSRDRRRVWHSVDGDDVQEELSDVRRLVPGHGDRAVGQNGQIPARIVYGLEREMLVGADDLVQAKLVACTNELVFFAVGMRGLA